MGSNESMIEKLRNIYIDGVECGYISFEMQGKDKSEWNVEMENGKGNSDDKTFPKGVKSNFYLSAWVLLLEQRGGYYLGGDGILIGWLLFVIEILLRN